MIPGEIVQDIYRLWKEWVELGNTEFEHPDDPDDVDDLFGKIAAVKSIHEQMEYRGVTPKQIKYLRYVRSLLKDLVAEDEAYKAGYSPYDDEYSYRING
jgi:hypothetical protein